MSRPRRWTDDQLRGAVATSTTWNDVVRAIGRVNNAKARATVQGHALRLGLDLSHLPTFKAVAPIHPDKELAPDGAISDAVMQSTSGAEVLRRLGLRVSGFAYARLRKRIDVLGLDTSHFRYQRWGNRPVPGVNIPFSRCPTGAYLSKAAGSVAAAWFLERGYRVALPVEPAPYDLVVESDKGLVRVQVKSTVSQDGGRWVVRIHRRTYNASRKPNAGGSRELLAYGSDEVDFFFILTGAGVKYLIPLGVTNGYGSLTLDAKYAAYRLD